MGLSPVTRSFNKTSVTFQGAAHMSLEAGAIPSPRNVVDPFLAGSHLATTPQQATPNLRQWTCLQGHVDTPNTLDDESETAHDHYLAVTAGRHLCLPLLPGYHLYTQFLLGETGAWDSPPLCSCRSCRTPSASFLSPHTHSPDKRLSRLVGGCHSVLSLACINSPLQEKQEKKSRARAKPVRDG